MMSELTGEQCEIIEDMTAAGRHMPSVFIIRAEPLPANFLDLRLDKPKRDWEQRNKQRRRK